MTDFAIAVAVASFGFGVVVGLFSNHNLYYAPLRERYDSLVELLAGMKRQGFVPQFAVEQRRTLDLSKDIRET